MGAWNNRTNSETVPPDGMTGGTVVELRPGALAMPMSAAVKARVMSGGAPYRVQKFIGGGIGAGIGHGDRPGDVPHEGTPQKFQRVPGGSTSPLVSASRQISKTGDQWETLINQGQVIPPPYDPWVLLTTVEESDVLPQMIETYATNISGFGVILEELFDTRDEDGEPLDRPPEAQQELEDLELFMLAANLELGLIGVMQCVDYDCEAMGNGYMETLRDANGKVASVEHAFAWTMRMGKLSQPVLADVTIRHPTTGELVTLRRWRRFRTFVQVRNHRVAYFKQYGDPRFINWRTGEYQDTPWGEDDNGNSLDGTEIVHRKVYSPHTCYGVPRWVGSMPHVKSGRQAAELVLGWFLGAPIGAKLAMVSGGTWKSDSMKSALGKIDDMARGSSNAWSLIGLEAEAAEIDALDDTRQQAPRMAIEDLAYELPVELYSGDNNLLDGMFRRVARMFRLPPVYWGGSDDFSRAAVQAAVVHTEEQVFVPLRQLRWLQWFNTELLPPMGVNFWGFNLRGANTADHAEVAKGITSLVEGGGASPNQLIKLWNKMTGQDTPPIAEPWADRPLTLTKLLVANGLDPNMPLADTDPDADPELDAEGVAIAAAGGSAQDTALNGAQVQAALEIVLAVPTGEITKDMAQAMLIEFFNLSTESASNILADVDNVLPREPEADPFGGDGGGDGDSDPVRKRARKSAPRIMAGLDRLAAQLADDLEQANPQWFV